MADDFQPSQWSATAASNTSVGGTSITENCAMSNLNNGERAIMAGVVGALTFVATSDSTDAYTATLAPAIDAYTNDFVYCVKFGTANTTTTPTLNLNSIGVKTITDGQGLALAAGSLNGDHFLIYDGTNFRVLNPAARARITASLGSDVALNNTSSFFDGPSIAQGTSGTWLVTGTVTVTSSSTDGFYVKLWDGTTVIASAWATNNVLNGGCAISVSGYISSPAANIKISVKDVSSTNGTIIFNQTGNSKDSTLSACRIA